MAADAEAAVATGENAERPPAFAPGDFPPETAKYFEFHFKGSNYDKTAYRVSPLLITHLENNEPSLTVLDMAGRNLDDAEITPVIRALRGNTTVTEIDLSRNTFDLAGLELAEVLKTNETVTKLNLHNNDMRSKAVIAMAEMLQVNTTLLELNLSCTLARKETKYIAEALDSNTTLTKLYMDNCQIADEEAKLLLEALDKSSVKEFRGFNNVCLDKSMRQALRGWKPKA